MQPPKSRLHPTFHVSCLKQRFGQHVVPLPSLPTVDSKGIIRPESVAVLQERSHQLRHRTVTQVLIQRQGKVLRMLLWRICTSCSNNFLTLWSRCFNLGVGVLLCKVCTLYNMMGFMAVICVAEAVMQWCDVVLWCKGCVVVVWCRGCDAEAMMQCYDVEAMMQ